MSSIRTLPAPDVALAVLAGHVRAFPPSSDAMLFRGDRGGPLLRTSVHAKWKRALRSAGLDEGLTSTTCATTTPRCSSTVVSR